MDLVRVLSLCLLTWSGSTSAQGPVVVKEDSDVVLPCSLSTQENLVSKLFDWRKVGQKKTEVFMYNAGSHYNNGRPGQDEQFKGRVSHFQDQLKHGNASIKITKTKVSDSGTYTCDFPLLPSRPTFHIELVVGASPRPYVRILDGTKDWSLLQCEVLGAFPQPTVEWTDSSGNILPAEGPKVTKTGDRSDVVRNTTVTKSDTYFCVSTQEKIFHQINSSTYVVINGAASEPAVTIIETHDGSVLQCEVLGASPKPKVQWQDSSGKVLESKDPQVTERGGSYDIILQTPVTKTGNFLCVVTQKQINHQTNATIYAIKDSGSNTGLIVGLVLGFLLLLALVVIGGGLVYIRQLKQKRGSDDQYKQTHQNPSQPDSSTSLTASTS